MKVRTIQIDDLPEVFLLGEKLFTSGDFDDLYTQEWCPVEVAGLFYSDGEHCFVAHQGDRLVGFALGAITPTNKSGKHGHLLWLGVDPLYRRKGIGEMLFDRFVSCVEVDVLIADVRNDNEDIVSFLRNRGFGDPSPHVYLTRKTRG